jgi:hypothetical protein
MPSEVNPVVPIELGGKLRHLKYTLNAECKFKELTGLDTFKEGIKFSDLAADQFRVLVWCCLLHEDKAITMEEIGEMIGRGNGMEVLTAVIKAFNLSLPAAKAKGDKKENAPLAKNPPAG